MTQKGGKVASTLHSSGWGQGFCKVGSGPRKPQLCSRAGMSDGVHPSRELVDDCRTRPRQKNSPATQGLSCKRFSPGAFAAALYTSTKSPSGLGRTCWREALWRGTWECWGTTR